MHSNKPKGATGGPDLLVVDNLRRLKIVWSELITTIVKYSRAMRKTPTKARINEIRKLCNINAESKFGIRLATSRSSAVAICGSSIVVDMTMLPVGTMKKLLMENSWAVCEKGTLLYFFPAHL